MVCVSVKDGCFCLGLANSPLLLFNCVFQVKVGSHSGFRGWHKFGYVSVILAPGVGLGQIGPPTGVGCTLLFTTTTISGLQIFALSTVSIFLVVFAYYILGRPPWSVIQPPKIMPTK